MDRGGSHEVSEKVVMRGTAPRPIKAAGQHVEKNDMRARGQDCKMFLQQSQTKHRPRIYPRSQCKTTSQHHLRLAAHPPHLLHLIHVHPTCTHPPCLTA